MPTGDKPRCGHFITENLSLWQVIWSSDLLPVRETAGSGQSKGRIRKPGVGQPVYGSGDILVPAVHVCPLPTSPASPRNRVRAKSCTMVTHEESETTQRVLKGGMVEGAGGGFQGDPGKGPV